jgi:hypothetical protein
MLLQAALAFGSIVRIGPHLDTVVRLPWPPRVLQCYRLIRPVVAFYPDERKTMTIPPGTLLTLWITGTQVGPVYTFLEGRRTIIQRQDIEADARRVEL